MSSCQRRSSPVLPAAVSKVKSVSGLRPDKKTGALPRYRYPIGGSASFFLNTLERRHYAKTSNSGWPANVLTMHPDGESVRRALEEGPYGRCVYYCDNNVVDHQVVNMNMTDGLTVSFTMCGFTADCSRYAKLMGTKGQIIADRGANTIEVTPFGKDAELIDVSRMAEDFSGHGGGDRGLMSAFLDFVTGEQSEDDTISSVERSLESHYIALAAEESRRNGGAVIRMEQVRK